MKFVIAIAKGLKTLKKKMGFGPKAASKYSDHANTTKSSTEQVEKREGSSQSTSTSSSESVRAPKEPVGAPSGILAVKAPKGVLVMYIGEDEEQQMRYEVPLKYLSFPSLRVLVEQSGDSGQELETFSKGPIKVSCRIELFERILKNIKAKEKEAICRELSYDDRLWSHLGKNNAAIGSSSRRMSLSGGEMRFSC